mmetsp:Transcript_149069/g.285655  ORF Transcript_149069/g.285655 Transcript_149069/m.285655 type:complete len:125 (+) Transcript_149069:48-422(+)
MRHSKHMVLWLDQRHHLVHVDARPQQPHAKGRCPDHHYTETPALALADVRGLLGEASDGHKRADDSQERIEDGPIDKPWGQETLRLGHVSLPHWSPAALAGFNRVPKAEPASGGNARGRLLLPQ